MEASAHEFLKTAVAVRPTWQSAPNRGSSAVLPVSKQPMRPMGFVRQVLDYLAEDIAAHPEDVKAVPLRARGPAIIAASRTRCGHSAPSANTLPLR